MSEPTETMAPIDASPTAPSDDAPEQPVKRGFFGNLFKRNKPVEVKVQQVPALRDDKSILQLKKGYNEIVDTMTAMRQHMQTQSDRADRMLEIMEQLPQVLGSIPETNKAQTQVLQAIHQNIQTQNETQVQLSAALSNLASATQQQEDAVKGIRSELNQQRADQAEIVGTLGATLGQVTQASLANTDAMKAVAKKAEETDRNTVELFDKSRRHSSAIAAISWAAAGLILIVAMFMFNELRTHQTNNASAPVAPAPTQPAPAAETPAPGAAGEPAASTTPDAPATPTPATGEPTDGQAAQANLDQAMAEVEAAMASTADSVTETADAVAEDVVETAEDAAESVEATVAEVETETEVEAATAAGE